MVLLFLSPLGLRAEEMPRGQVSDPVHCLHDANQTYSLYLPASYQAERRWPILYCFDPGGRGAVPVALFREGAEKYGIIVAGSNNSKNGPWENILQAARAVWRDTHDRLAIDDQRIYAAGFSGGARAACGLGKMLSVRLSGVIACGGGLPAWLEPENVKDVSWFGTAGLYDFNYAEMQELAKKLAMQGTPRRLEVFAGRHSWPPPELALTALEWLELQAMKAGVRARDEGLIVKLLAAALDHARDLENKQEWGTACSLYDSIVADFSGLADVTIARERALILQKSTAVKNFNKAEIDRESDYAKSIARLKSVYCQLRGPLNEPGKARKIVQDLKIPVLRKKAGAGDLGPEQIISKRLLSELAAQAWTDGENYLLKKDGPRAVITFQIMAEISPGHPAPMAALASALALSGERKKALKILVQAMAAGFDDFQSLEQDPAWDELRQDPEYIKIINGMKKSPGHD